MTERMVRTAADVLAPDVELVAITATRGMPALGDWIEHRAASDAPVALSIVGSER
jgi:hypothetical protein